MTALSHSLTSPRISWLFLGIVSGVLLSLAGVGLLQSRTTPTAKDRVEISALSLPPAAAPSPASPVEDPSLVYSAQLAAAEAEWARQLDAARSGSEEARREAVLALNALYQAELARERDRHAAELEQLRAAYAAGSLKAPEATEVPEAPKAPEFLALPTLVLAEHPAPVSLVERAQSPDVALALGPFLESGFAQLDNHFSETALPFSFSELAATGALEPAPEGWRTLYKIASSRRDRARTRWPAEPSAEDLAAAQRAQDLLRELGPALVQIGKLRP